MSRSQDDHFASSEGNEWYRRNREQLQGTEKLEKDLPLKLIDMYGIQPIRVVELGAANGYRVAELARRYGCSAVAVEPSVEAIEEGKGLFPEVEFLCGTAANTGLEPGFDLVVISFVLHWVDRSALMRTAAEVDRLLDDGGFLVVSDFHPGCPRRVPYHHLPGQEVFTYKQDYSALFTAGLGYQEVALLTSSMAGRRLDAGVPDGERAATWLLRKRGEGLHAPAPSRGPA